MLGAYSVDSITIKKWNGNDQWGEPLSKTNIAITGYVEFKNRLVRNAKGEEVLSEAMAYLGSCVEGAAFLGRKISLEDKVILPGESVERAIIDIRRPKAFTNWHVEIYLA